MAVAKKRCVCATLIVLTLVQFSGAKFTIPNVNFKLLKPKGLEASIPALPGITTFAFNGHVNRQISSNDIGTLKGEILQPENERFVYKNHEVELKPGDVIRYYVFVAHDRTGYIGDRLNFTVTDLDNRDTDPDTPTTSKPCVQSLTTVRGAKACSGEVIFEDNFDELRTDFWTVEQYIPSAHPEYPFVSYQKSATIVSVSDGRLSIAPKLQQTMPGFNAESISMGELDLFNGCTASAEMCHQQASGADILPPVASGRLTSSFVFKYGTVYIRAKLPKGDWLYPEILLEPFLKKYGKSNFASGVIKIASARGNKELKDSRQNIFGNKVLYGGPIMDFQCRDQLIKTRTISGESQWGDDFHEYSVRWTPEAITLSVDGAEWARVEATIPLRDQFPTCPRVPMAPLAKGTNLAPFDDYFYLTLGVAAGGISEFPDNTYTTARRDKPWTNTARKAMLYFWENLDSWHKTWTDQKLVVDYVKIVAL